MDNIKITQLRKAQLYIADEIKRICEKYDIKYSLDAGSLIGAVRHGGFIPWDDDMDFSMLKEEYERFISIAPTELNNDFFLDNYGTNPENALLFTKIRLKNTRYIEAKGNDKALHNEVFVDIFPYYYVSDSIVVRIIEGLIMGITSEAILSKAGHKVWMGDSFTTRLKFIPTDIIGRLLSEKVLRKIIDKLFNNHSGTKYVCIQDGLLSTYLHWYIPVNYFHDYVKAKFEDHEYRIPKEYDKCLTIIYGDYMTIPPVDRQITHMIKELDLGNYKF